MDQHKNLAISTVATAPSPASSGTSLVVSTGEGSRFPATPFNATVWPDGTIPTPANAEIVRVTNIVSDTLTITRTQEGTSARAIIIGDRIAATITAKTLTDIETAFAGTNGAITGGSITVNSSGVSVNLPAYLTTAALSQDSSKYAGTGFTSAGANISLSGTNNTAGLSLSASVAAQSNQSAIKGLGVSNTGATAGNTGLSTGIDWVLAGSSPLSLSQSTAAGGPNTIWIQPAAWLTTADLSANSSKYVQEWALTGNTAGTTSSAQGTRLYISGGNSITVSGSSNSIVLSVGNYLTTAMQSNAATISNINVSGGTTSSNLSAFKLIDSQGVSWSLDTGSKIYATVKTDYLTSQSTQYLALTLGGNTAGTTTFNASNNATLFLHGGNNITLSGNGSSVTISGANAGGAQTGISGVVVSDTTYTSGTVSFSNAGNITISSSVNGATQYIRLSGNAAQTNQSAIKGFGVSNTGQTAGNTGISTGVDWVLAGSQSITLSQSTAGGGPNTIWVQHPAWLTTAMQSNAATISNINVSAGTTSNNLSALTFSNSNGISFGINGSTVTASASTVGTATTAYNVSADNSVGTVTRWAAEDHRHGGNLISQFDPFEFQAVTNSTIGQSTVYIVPFDVQGYISASRVNFFLSVAFTYSGAPTSNQTAWLAMGYALYTRMTGANSDRISQLTSYSLSHVSGNVSSSTRLSVTNYIGLSNATSHSTSQFGVNNATAGTYLTSSIGGYRVLALPMNLSLTPGRYYMAVSNQSASNGNSFVLQQSVVQNQYSNNIAYRPFGAVSAASNASFYGATDGLGIYSAQTAAFPNSIPLTSDSIRGAPIMTLPYFNISGINTAAGIL